MEKRTVTDFIIVHHSATDRDSTTFASIKNYHINNNGWDNVGYHKVIEASGKIYDGMPEGNVGYHCLHAGYNYNSLAVCLTGNFQKQTPTQEQLTSLEKVLSDWQAKYNIPKDRILGHRETGASTACPGNSLVTFLENYRKEETTNWLKEDIPTEVEEEFGLKKIKRYSKYWTFDEIIKDWVKLTKELDETKSNDKKRLLELTEKLEETEREYSDLVADKNVLETNLEACERDMLEMTKKHKLQLTTLQKQLEETSTRYDDLLKDYENIQENLDAGYAEQISRLKKTIRDLERRIIQLQKPEGVRFMFPSWKKALIEAYRVFVPVFLATLATLISTEAVNGWEDAWKVLIVPAITAGIKGLAKYTRDKYFPEEYDKVIYKLPA